MSDVVVSICCLAYNHEQYIRECLDGFLMQKTSFDYEILIHDDASTDGTANIIREYENKFPEIIKPVYQMENKYSQGVNVTFQYNFSRAKGKYIALCEGDDYWIDPSKLQKQVDFLEKNKDYVGVGTNFKTIDQSGNVIKEARDYKSYNEPEIVEISGIPKTLTVMYRNIPQAFERIADIRGISNGDELLAATLRNWGKVARINQTMGIYRIHENGAYSSKSSLNKHKMTLKSAVQIQEYLKNKGLVSDLQDKINKNFNRVIAAYVFEFQFKNAIDFIRGYSKYTTGSLLSQGKNFLNVFLKLCYKNFKYK